MSTGRTRTSLPSTRIYVPEDFKEAFMVVVERETHSSQNTYLRRFRLEELVAGSAASKHQTIRKAP